MAVAFEYDGDELVGGLARCGRRQLRAYYRAWGKLRDLVRVAVGGCTFRAFRGLDVGPSWIFRGWARKYLSPARLDELAGIENQADYDAFLEEAFRNLAAAWAVLGGKDLGFGPGMKLLNLLMKSILRSRRFSPAERGRLLPLLHVPLDKFSLAAVRRVARTGEYGPVVHIPRNPRMGFVTTRERYDGIQRVMRGLATAAGVAPICVDLLAWDLAHS
jgi:hypothetical protein